MAAIVCHGLQSRLESQLVDSRTLRFRLPSPLPPLPPQPIDLSFKPCFWDSNLKTQYEEQENINTNNTNTNMGGWSFLEALSNVSQGSKEQPPQKEESAYVHPQQKRSSLILSPKSLELCTENLGNESGTDIVENGIDMFSSPQGKLETGEQIPQQQQQKEPLSRQNSAAKKAKTMNFPPPLTTIRGSESLRVRPHREDGRLVIEVTKVPPSPACFLAERSHGRLRLCFLKNHAPSFDPEGDDDDVVVDENEISTNESFEEEFGNGVIGQAQDVEEDDEETEEETGEEEEKGDFACVCDDMRMEKNKIEIDMPRRCNEGGEIENNELLLNWGEPFWVATS